MSNPTNSLRRLYRDLMQEYGRLVQPFGLGYSIPEHINKRANELVKHATNILELIQKTDKSLPKKQAESNAAPVRVVRIAADEAARIITTYSIGFAGNGASEAWAQLQSIGKAIEPEHGLAYIAISLRELSKDMLAAPHTRKPANWDNAEFLKWLSIWLPPFIKQFTATNLNKGLPNTVLKRLFGQQMVYIFGAAGAREAWEAWGNNNNNDNNELLLI